MFFLPFLHVVSLSELIRTIAGDLVEQVQLVSDRHALSFYAARLTNSQTPRLARPATATESHSVRMKGEVSLGAESSPNRTLVASEINDLQV